MVVLLAIASAGLTGCVQAQGCPGWAGYSSPAEALEASTPVKGRVLEKVGAEPLHGGTANVWSVSVDEWLTRDGERQIEVISPPSACGESDDPYFGPDPFETAVGFEEAIIFLHKTDAGWMAINPSQGVLELGDDGSLPATWPDEQQ